jgi:hypothetical protein
VVSSIGPDSRPGPQTEHFWRKTPLGLGDSVEGAGSSMDQRQPETDPVPVGLTISRLMAEGKRSRITGYTPILQLAVVEYDTPRAMREAGLAGRGGFGAKGGVGGHVRLVLGG